MTSESKTHRTYGPLTPMHIKLLSEKLDTVNSEYKVLSDEDLMNQAQKREKNSPEASPFFHNTPGISMKEYLFIDIPLKDILVVRSDLIKLGFENKADSTSEASLHVEEYICPKCSYLQNSRGLCIRHQISLVPYYEKGSTRNQLKGKIIFTVFALMILTLILFVVRSFSTN